MIATYRTTSTSMILLIILIIIQSIQKINANPSNILHPTPLNYPRAGENPIVPSHPLFDSKNKPSPRRRLVGNNLPLDIVIYTQPGNATGGIPSPQQTVVRAIKQNGQFARALDSGLFLGEMRTTEQLLHHVICAIGINPPIVASGRQRNMTTDIDLWSLLEFDTPTALFYKVDDLENGIMEATFSGVFINELGSGYTFQYISRMSPVGPSANFPTYFIESNYFNVLLGPVNRLSLYIPEGTATGGLPFRPQPTLAIVDRGNNICEWDQSTSVRVELMYSPTRCENNECRTGKYKIQNIKSERERASRIWKAL